MAEPVIRVRSVITDEGRGTADFVFRLSEPSALPVSVSYRTLNGTADAAGDYVDGGVRTVTFEPYETVKTVSIALRPDTLLEARQSFVLQLESPVNAIIGNTQALATIVDNDAPASTPSVSVSDTVVDEAEGVATLFLTLDRPSADPVSVLTRGNIGGSNISFAPGETSASASLPVYDNLAPEDFRLLRMVLGLGEGSDAVFDDAVGHALIVPSDAPSVAFPAVSAMAPTVAEAAGTARFDVRLSAPSEGYVSVRYSLRNGSADSASDYLASGSGTLVFAPGETARAVDVAIRDDATAEGDETFELVLDSAVGATLASPVARAAIWDDDGRAVYSRGFSNDVYTLESPTDRIIEVLGGGVDTVQAPWSYTLAETLENLTLTGNAAIDGTGNAGHNWMFGNDAANALAGLAGDDRLDGGGGADRMAGGTGDDVYQVGQPGDIVIEATGAGQDTVVAAINYVLAANVENLVLAEQAGAAEGSGNELSNTITGNAFANVLDGRSGADFMYGGAGNDSYRVDDLKDTVRDGSDDAADRIESSVDYTLVDTGAEQLTLTGSTAIVAIGNSGANVLIGNSADNRLDGLEGADTMSGGLGNDVYRVDNLADRVNETEGQGTDRVDSSVSWTLGAGQEHLELIGPGASDGTGNASANRIAGNQAANILSGLDGADTLIGRLGHDTLSGGGGSDRLVFDTLLDATSNVDTVIGFASGEDSFVLGSAVFSAIRPVDGVLDNAAFRSGAGVTTAGDASDRVIYDSSSGRVYYDADGTGTASSAVLFAKLAAPATVTAADFRIESPPAVSHVTVSDPIVEERAGEAVFTVSLDRPSSSVVSMHYAVDPGNVDDNPDYVPVSGSLSFAPGEVSRTVKVTLIDDSETEGAESFSLRLSNVIGATPLDPDGTAIIMASDAPAVAVPVISAADVVVDESRDRAEFIVRLSAPSDRSVSVDYRAVDGTADASGDYVDAGLRTLVFAPGETVKAVSFALRDDRVAESKQTFSLQFENAVNGLVGHSKATALVIDNDAVGGLPRVSVGDVVVDETAGIARFAVTLDRPGIDVVSMTYETSRASAWVDDDFAPVAGTISFAPGETSVMVAVPLIDDSANEGDETFMLGVRGLVGAVATDPVGTASIVANDGAATGATLSVDSPTVAENSGVVQFIVRLRDAGAESASVRYALIANSADAASDYVDAGPGTLIFEPGETTKVVTVAIRDDRVVEADQTFTLVLNNAVGAAIETSSVAATIVDNDRHAVFDEGRSGDTYELANASERVIEQAWGGTDTIVIAHSYTLPGQVENLSLVGSGAIDGTGHGADNVLIGNDAANRLMGFGGNDTMDGRGGPDVMTGGIGDDRYFVNNIGDRVNERPDEGVDRVMSSITYTLPSAVEQLALIGNGAIAGFGNDADNLLAGNANHNRLDGGAGSDLMYGGQGNDVYLFDDAGDWAIELAGEGSDRIESTVRIDGMPDHTDNATLLGHESISATGNNLRNVLIGNDGNNTLDGHEHIDTLIGGKGDDRYHVDVPLDVVQEVAGEGLDTVQATVSWTLGNAVENLVLSGVAAINGTGNTGNNLMVGNGVANVLSGLDGNDTLRGGAGNDSLSGGNGPDRFVFDSPLNAATNVDTVSSFTLGQDTFVLSNTTFANVGPVNAPLAAAAFHSAAGATTAADASDRVIYNASSGDLFYDADGTGAGSTAVLFAKLTVPVALSAGNFVVEPQPAG